MNPTLRASDVLQVREYGDREIQPGDVVLFMPPGNVHKVVHRVVSIRADGVRTRGDNCIHRDPWVIDPGQIIGQVIYARRGSRRSVVYGGIAGQLFALGVRMIKRVNQWISVLLRPAYRRLAQAGLFRQWLPGKMGIRVVSFSRPHGEEKALLMGRHMIGRFLPGREKWQIRRPFRLFVDESGLHK